jgi:hypothetical protein
MLHGVAAQADQLAFGTFSSPDNAANWARKLSATFGQAVDVVETELDTRVLYRVTSAELSDEQRMRMARRADTAGIRYWRLSRAAPKPQGTPQSAATPASEPMPAPDPGPPQTPARSDLERLPAQLGAARLSPPSPVEAPVEGRPQAARAEPVQAKVEWDLGLQTRTFANSGVYGQDRLEGSFSVQMEYFRGWRDDSRSVTVTPFVRVDSADDERTHADLREAYYSRVGDSWDLHVGARRVFWGVTEFHHLIDVVNQTDLVENIDGEDKLGQPMVQLSMVRNWGVLDLFALAGFRERTFPGSDGRVRVPFDIEDDATYESGAERRRMDAALRWSHYLGPFEVGIHHFSGTSRDPMLIPEAGAAGEVVLRPYYPVIDQTGIDAQAFYGDWAFKLEGLTRSGYGDRYAAANVGFERTLVGVFGSRADLGLVAEYMFDERDEEAMNTLFEHDIALGGRVALNDFADTKALIGVIFDTNDDDYFISLEASRRLGNSWLMSVEGRVFSGGEDLHRNTPPAELLSHDYKTAWLQEDDYVQLEFKKFL